MPSSTVFPASSNNPISLPYTITQGGLNYQVQVGSPYLSALFTSNNLPAITSAFTVTPIGNGSLNFVGSVTPLITYSLAELGFSYLITPGDSGYNVRPVTLTPIIPVTTVLGKSGTYTVNSYSNFQLPNTPDSRLYIISVTSQGVGSTITATGNYVFSGNGSSGTTYTFPKTGFYRLDNFLAPGTWVITYFRSNHKIGAIVGASPSNNFPPYPGNPLTNNFNITQGGYNYTANTSTVSNIGNTYPVSNFSITVIGNPFTTLTFNSPNGPIKLFAGYTYNYNYLSSTPLQILATSSFPFPEAPGGPFNVNPTSGNPPQSIILNVFPGYDYTVYSTTGYAFSVSNPGVTVTVQSGGPIPYGGTVYLQNGSTYLILGPIGGNPLSLIPFLVQPSSTSFAAPRIRYNNTTAQNGTQLDTLIDSDIPSANAHFNNIGVMERKDLPAFVIPITAPDANYNIQQIGTESDHYRGGNQIERTNPVVVPAGNSYTANEKDKIILLGGNNNIILPIILALDSQATSGASEVPNGTIYTLTNLSTNTCTVNASGIPFDCGSTSSGNVTINAAETVTFTAIALSGSRQVPTFYTFRRSSC
jgi:hypothetical protein